jgi:hypothetical protein
MTFNTYKEVLDHDFKDYKNRTKLLLDPKDIHDMCTSLGIMSCIRAEIRAHMKYSNLDKAQACVKKYNTAYSNMEKAIGQYHMKRIPK